MTCYSAAPTTQVSSAPSVALKATPFKPRPETAYIDWIKRYIFFHHKRHPAEMGAPEMEQFLNYLAVQENVAASTQNQALSALIG
jgi:hypothetical protein